MTRAAAAAIVLLVTVSVTAAEVPAARLRADGTVAVSLPSSLLSRRDVRRQLTSGLTTTFVVIAESRGQRGGARISVRYEPWEEVYLVATRGIDRSSQSLRFATVETLTEWWRDAAVPALPRATADTVRLTLEVLPFSIEEQRETQQWLSRALGDVQEVQEELSTPKPDDQADAGAEPADAGAGTSVLDIIIGTSIQRRPIVRYRWTVPVIR